MRLGKMTEALWRLDWPLIFAVVALTLVGLSTIYSVDLSRGEKLSFFTTQAISFVLSIGVLMTAASIHGTRYEFGARFFYGLILVLLVGVLIFGQTIRGTTGWFRFAGFSFQPVELAKAGLIIFLAWRIEREGRRFSRLSFVVATGVLAFATIGLIMLQPDLGSAMVIAGIWLGMILLSGTRARYIVGLVLIGLAAFALGWFFLFKPYQKDRLHTFIDPGRDPLGAGYNVNQSIIAVGAGKFIGRGLGFGSQSQLHFLPEAQTDFIVSVIGEELGFVGLSLVLLLYGIILWRLLRIASLARTDFAAYTASGVALLFLIQMLVNMGAAFGLLPVTGVTLPFVSYGGSSLIINYFLIGLVLSLARFGKAV